MNNQIMESLTGQEQPEMCYAPRTTRTISLINLIQIAIGGPCLQEPPTIRRLNFEDIESDSEDETDAADERREVPSWQMQMRG